VGVLILSSYQAVAQVGNIRFGNLTIVPSLTLEGVVDDNIFLGNGSNDTTELKEGDYIFHIMPGIQFNYDLPERGDVNLGYRGDFAFYAQNGDNDWQRHNLTFGLNYEAPSGLIFGLDDSYVDAEDPFGNLEQFNQGIITKRWTNDFYTRLGYAHADRYKGFVFYNRYKQDYKEDRDFSQDYTIDEIGVGVETRLWPKTWGFFRYHYGQQDFFTEQVNIASANVTDANDADNTRSRINVGLAWDPDAKVTGEVNFGYVWLSYDNVVDSTDRLYEDKNTWVANTSVTWLATASTTLILDIMRAVRPRAASSKDFFTDTRIGLDIRQFLLPKLLLFAGIGYGIQDYKLPEAPNPSRDDDILDGHIRLSYKTQDWLSADAAYTYEDKDSNYDVNDYTNNRIMLSITAVY